MDTANPLCPRHCKGRKSWRKYIKGAAGIFARYACSGAIVRVITLPPSKTESIRASSTYRTIEEPILKGASSPRHTPQIHLVHPLVKGAEDMEYQVWPEDHTNEWLELYGINAPISRPLRKKSRTSPTIGMQSDPLQKITGDGITKPITQQTQSMRKFRSCNKATKASELRTKSVGQKASKTASTTYMTPLRMTASHKLNTTCSSMASIRTNTKVARIFPTCCPRGRGLQGKTGSVIDTFSNQIILSRKEAFSAFFFPLLAAAVAAIPSSSSRPIRATPLPCKFNSKNRHTLSRDRLQHHIILFCKAFVVTKTMERVHL